MSVPESEIIFVKHSSEFKDDLIEREFHGMSNLNIFSIGEKEFLSDGLNAGIKASRGNFIAKIDDDDIYGKNYLLDALDIFSENGGVSLVGKNTFFSYVESYDTLYLRFPGRANKITSHVHGGTFVWSSEKTRDILFRRIPSGADSFFVKDCILKGLSVFSGSEYNFVHVRYIDKSKHTWKIPDEEFIKNALPVCRGIDLSRVFR